MKSPLLDLPHSFGMCDNLINFDFVHIIKLNKMMLTWLKLDTNCIVDFFILSVSVSCKDKHRFSIN